MQNTQNAKVFKTQSAVPPVCIHISNCTNIKCAVYLEHAAHSAHQSPYIAKTYKMHKNKMQRASCCSVAASLSQISGAAAGGFSPLYVRMHTLWTVLCTVWSVVNSFVQKVQCCAKSVHKVCTKCSVASFLGSCRLCTLCPKICDSSSILSPEFPDWLKIMSSSLVLLASTEF